LVEFVARAADRQPLVEIRRMQARGGPNNVGDGPRGPPSEQVTAERYGQQKNDSYTQQQAIETGHLQVGAAQRTTDSHGQRLRTGTKHLPANDAVIAHSRRCVKRHDVGWENVQRRRLLAGPHQRPLMVEQLDEQTASRMSCCLAIKPCVQSLRFLSQPVEIADGRVQFLLDEFVYHLRERQAQSFAEGCQADQQEDEKDGCVPQGQPESQGLAEGLKSFVSHSPAPG